MTSAVKSKDIKNLFFRSYTLDQECLRTDGLSSKYHTPSVSALLPEYGCLVLSPANLWQKDPVAFQVLSELWAKPNKSAIFLTFSSDFLPGVKLMV